MSTKFAFFNADDFGRTIAEGRRVAGVTQQELADAVGVDRTYLSRIEQGNPSIQLEHVFKMLQHLGIKIEGTMSDRSES
jgi:transcriptional regulator with XRE-family HTH domain